MPRPNSKAHTKTPIDDVVTVNELRIMAGNRTFHWGEAVFQSGAVHQLHSDGEELTGEVYGPQVYYARLINDTNFLDGECDCPDGLEGVFCKHLVALGLAYLDQQNHTLRKSILSPSANGMARPPKANPPAGGVKLRELKRMVDKLLLMSLNLEECDDEFGEEAEINDYIKFTDQGVEFLDVLQQLADQEEFKLLWNATVYALDCFIDNFNAQMDVVHDFIIGLGNSFLDAVHAKVKSNNVVLNVFTAWENKSQVSCDHLSVILKELPAEVRARWAVAALEKLRGYPPYELGSFDYDRERRYIEKHLLDWAIERKDSELKLEVLEKKVCTESDVIELAAEYRCHGMQEKILPLLIRAHETFNDDWEITKLLAEELLMAGRHEEALNVVWEEFTDDYMNEAPLANLEAISRQANCWKFVYQKVLDFLAALDRKEYLHRHDAFGRPYIDDIRQRRVEVLFTHGDQQAAWKLAQGAYLSDDCWLKLAEWRSKKSPKAAASAINSLIESALHKTGKNANSHVIELLMVYRRYLKMADNEAEFAVCCANIRQRCKRRQRLLEQMDAAKM